MKFAHIADCHLGGWREPKLKELGMNSFSKSIDICIERGVDFVLLAGDLFNTSLPSIDVIKCAVIELKRLQSAGMPVYAIAGSHDFSPSGKTMLDVLEEADLLINVCRGEVSDNGTNKLRLKFTQDSKTGAKITGMLGKRGMLDKKYYEDLDRESLEAEEGFKIFMFHTAITEMKPKELEKMDSAPASLLPKNFDYYAGGHVHIVSEVNLESHKRLIYPGPTFPNSFSELENLRDGSMCVYEDGNLENIKLGLFNVESIVIDCKGKASESVIAELRSGISALCDKELTKSIVLVRLHGKLGEGKISDIDFKSLFLTLNEKNPLFVLRSTSQLSSREFEELNVSANSADDIEEALIQEHKGELGLVNSDSELVFIKNIMSALKSEKNEGEKVADFEKRIIEDMDSVGKELDN